MISAVVKSDLLWGIIATGTVDTITKAALNSLGIQNDLAGRGAATAVLNTAIFVCTDKILFSIPGIVWGLSLQLKDIFSLQMRINQLDEERRGMQAKLTQLEAELEKERKNIDALERAIYEVENVDNSALIKQLQGAIAQLEHNRQAT